MTNETYCPCCGSDDTAHQETNHEDGILTEILTETFKCGFCDSTFKNVYRMETQKVVEDNSDTMHMLKAKEVVLDELKVLGDNINTSRGFADGRIHMLIDCLAGHLNDLDSKDLAESYRNSSFHQEYEETKAK